MHGENAFEKLAGLVPEHHGEDVIVHDALDVLRDAAEEFFAVEDGGQLAADFVEQLETRGLVGFRVHQSGSERIDVTEREEGGEL